MFKVVQITIPKARPHEQQVQWKYYILFNAQSKTHIFFNAWLVKSKVIPEACGHGKNKAAAETENVAFDLHGSMSYVHLQLLDI